MNAIIAVVLTYNRKDLLTRCLDAISRQTRPCDGVIVVNNASSDGTEEMLKELAMPGLKVHTLSENVGASGGFNIGFKLGYQSGADYVWVMDDDVIPEPSALENLLDAESLLQTKQVDHAFLVSSAYTENGLVTNAPAVDSRPNNIRYENWPLLLEHGIAPVRRATFVSILVPRCTLEQYGLPLASMFIWGEDTEYTLRITEKMPGFIVGKSKVQHLRQESGSIDILSESNPRRVRYHRHHVRNELYIARKYHRPRQVVLSMLHQLKLTLSLICHREFLKAGVIMAGLLESSHFSPVREPANAPLNALGITLTSFVHDHDQSANLPQITSYTQGMEDFINETVGQAMLG